MTQLPSLEDVQAMDSTLIEVRRQIDAVDREVVRLLGRRTQYVQQAAQFKKSAEDVAAKERFKSMLHVRRTWATEEGLDPDMVEKLYRDMIQHFIGVEMRHWNANEAQMEAR